MTEPVLNRLKCNHLLIWSLLIAIIVQSSDSEVVHVNPYGASPEKFNWRLRWEFSGSKLYKDWKRSNIFAKNLNLNDNLKFFLCTSERTFTKPL